MPATDETLADDEPSSDGHETTELLLISGRADLPRSISDAAGQADPSLSVRIVRTGEDGMRALTGKSIDCVVSEYELPDTDGLALFDELRTIEADVPVILYPKRHADRMATRAVDAGITRYLRQSTDTDDHAVLIHAIRQTIDGRQTAERARSRFKSTRLDRAIDAAGHAVFITDPDGYIQYVNPAFEEITGYSAEFAIGSTPRILKSGRIPERYYSTLWETIRSGDVWSEPILNRRRSGELYHAEETIAPFTDESGEIEGYVAVQTDVTERIETREQLETFKRIVQRVDDPIMIQDAEGKFELANDAVGEYAGAPSSELIGSDEFAFMDRAAAEAIAERKRRVLENQQPETYEVRPTLPTKGERSFVTTRYPKRDERGSVDGTIAICRDVTEQLERERQLRVLVRILRHNINNKMSIVLGNAELVRDELDDGDETVTDRIIDAGQELVTLAETKRKIVGLLVDPPENGSILIGAMLDRIATDARKRFPESTIAVDCPAGLRVSAVPQLDEAIAELVENAIVHAERDDPAVDVTVRPDRRNDDVGILIADNGPGVPEVERDVLAPDAELSQTHHGRGLGLGFADQVLKASQGSLDIRETPDGSIVELRLLAAPAGDAG
ncbi:MAG: PAS domain S-box protein [Halobacteriota archaeon]|uniref:PAS domain S-box protein n=1 Tax=Natronomonas sp. TaxID=2184060 RepID=UPI003976913A